MQPADADAYFGQVLRGAARGTRLARAQALKTYFLFLELRHKVEIHQLTGHVAERPVDEINRPRGSWDAALRIPPSEAQVGMLFAGWRDELAGCRKFAPAARNYAAGKLMAEIGLRVNEVCQLDLDDVGQGTGPVREILRPDGQGRPGAGQLERMVPLINNARATLAWFVQDVWGHFDDDHARAGAPLLPSERKNPDGTCARVGDEALRAALAGAAAVHLPDWPGRVTPAPAAALLRQPAVKGAELHRMQHSARRVNTRCLRRSVRPYGTLSAPGRRRSSSDLERHRPPGPVATMLHLMRLRDMHPRCVCCHHRASGAPWLH